MDLNYIIRPSTRLVGLGLRLGWGGAGFLSGLDKMMPQSLVKPVSGGWGPSLCVCVGGGGGVHSGGGAQCLLRLRIHCRRGVGAPNRYDRGLFC